MKFPANPTISHQAITSTPKVARSAKSTDAGSGSVKLLGLGFIACLITLCAGSLHAADNAAASLKAGDEFLSKQDYDHAMTEYDAAVKQSDSPGMKSLSLGKKGEVYLAQKNYTAAKQAADEALTVQELAPVAKVIALKVLGECQLKGDPKDYPGAIKSLEAAYALQGVDWAQPLVALLLGDAYRFSGNSEKAIATLTKLTEMPNANNDVKSIAYLNLGSSYQYDKKDATQAKAAYQKAVELNPDLKKTVDEHLAKLN
jgi:tetratricopeptide (TPR) repeat protein